MNKVGATYWSKQTATARARNRRGSAAVKRTGSAVSRWMALAVVIGTMSVLCLAVNMRAFVEMNHQSLEYKRLNDEAQRLSSANVVLQEEIKNLKDDPKTIEREARKIGMSRPNEKILVQTN